MKCVGARHATEPGDTCASSNQCEVTDVRGSLQNIKDPATARAREKDGLWKGPGLPVHVPAAGWSLILCKGGVCALNLTP